MMGKWGDKDMGKDFSSLFSNLKICNLNAYELNTISQSLAGESETFK
jgi:hypothetical protein